MNQCLEFLPRYSLDEQTNSPLLQEKALLVFQTASSISLSCNFREYRVRSFFSLMYFSLWVMICLFLLRYSELALKKHFIFDLTWRLCVLLENTIWRNNLWSISREWQRQINLKNCINSFLSLFSSLWVRNKKDSTWHYSISLLSIHFTSQTKLNCHSSIRHQNYCFSWRKSLSYPLWR